jgi:hypothetical protein
VIVFVSFGPGSLSIRVPWILYKHNIQNAFVIASYKVVFGAVINRDKTDDARHVIPYLIQKLIWAKT